MIPWRGVASYSRKTRTPFRRVAHPSTCHHCEGAPSIPRSLRNGWEAANSNPPPTGPITGRLPKAP
jgi:hypothetical protein